MQKLTAVVSLILALGAGAVCVGLLNRQRDLEERIARLEKQKAPSPRAASAPVEPEAAPLARTSSPTAPPPAEAARPATPLPAAPAEPVAPAVREAVAREVERQLKERGSSGFTVHPIQLEDPVTVMEKELVLSPAQKLRIAEIWKRRDEEFMKRVEGGPGQGGFLEHAKQLKEVESRYDDEIKRELDFTQQARYDELRKQGKLHGGNVVIQLNVEEKGADKK